MVTYEILGRTRFGKITAAIAVPFLLALLVSPQVGSDLWRNDGYDLALRAGVVAALLAMIVPLVLGLISRGNSDHTSDA